MQPFLEVFDCTTSCLPLVNLVSIHVYTVLETYSTMNYGIEATILRLLYDCMTLVCYLF